MKGQWPGHAGAVQRGLVSEKVTVKTFTKKSNDFFAKKFYLEDMCERSESFSVRIRCEISDAHGTQADGLTSLVCKNGERRILGFSFYPDHHATVLVVCSQPTQQLPN